MRPIPGAPPPSLQELVRVDERMSFVYVEHCIVHREANAITATDERGTVHIPAATLGALMLGPGTSVSHQAMTLLAESGSTAVWVGERGVRYYAHGRPLTHKSRLLEAQAAAVSSRASRLQVARAMYALRFPGEDVSGLSMTQLRGREGARVRRAYRDASRRTGVRWAGRNYDPDDYSQGDAINQALSAAATCLYGIVHSVIVALGCSPGLGFVHTGHDRSFVYDIADLYRAEIVIPIAFEVAAQSPEDVGASTRRAVRDAVFDGKIMSRAARDIRQLLIPAGATDEDEIGDVVHLWDEQRGSVAAGRSYDSPELDEDDVEW